HGRVRYNSSCKNLPVSNSLQDLMPNSQGFLQVLADVPERSGPSGSSDCFVGTFNANPAKGLRIIFQGDRGRGTQNALGRASRSDSFVCADHDDEAYSRPMTTMRSSYVPGGMRCCKPQPRDSPMHLSSSLPNPLARLTGLLAALEQARSEAATREKELGKNLNKALVPADENS